MFARKLVALALLAAVTASAQGITGNAQPLPVNQGGTGTTTSTGTGSTVLSISPTITGTPAIPPSFPNIGLKGSLVGVGLAVALTQVSWYPGTNNALGCTNTGAEWLVSGTFRNVTVSTSNTNGVNAAAVGADANCQYGIPVSTTFSPGPAPGGPIIPANAVAGGFTSPTTYKNFWHQEAGYSFAFAANKLGQTSSGVAASTITSIAAEFVDDVGLYHTILPNGSTAALTASSTQYLGFYGVPVNSTELTVAMPIPIAGTIDGVVLCGNNAITASVTVTLRKSGSSTANTFTIPTSGNVCISDQTDTVAVAAGDYVTLQTVSGATTQLIPIGSQISFYPSSGTNTIIGGYLGGTTVTTTKTFNAPLTQKNSTTEASAETVLPVSETCTNLYVVKSTANSGVTTTYTIRDNGVDTAITGTESSGTGAILLYSGTGVTIAAGHSIDLSYVTASGTSGVMAGWSMACQ